MMGPTHRLAGALAGAGYASVTSEPLSLIMIGAVVATASSNGPLSPDTDQNTVWARVRSAARLIPLVGGFVATLLGHRRLTHWWGLPVAAWWWGIPALPAEVRWTVTYLLIGWVSHLVGDAIFGRVPLLPWGGWHVGLGLDTGGFIETGRTKSGTRLSPVAPIRLAMAAALIYILWAGVPAFTLPTLTLPTF